MKQRISTTQLTGTVERPLEGWKEISSFLQRSVRTAKRWDQKEGLPVHRQVHESRTSVYAFPSELDSWRGHREPPAESPRSVWLRPVPAFAATIALAAVLLTAGSGPQVGVVAQAANVTSARQVWVGAAGAGRGAPSPDGRYVSFTDPKTGNLGIRNVEAGTQRLLTAEGSRDQPRQEAYLSVWSPDGIQIAYTWRRWGAGFEVRVLTLDDPKPRVLVPAGGYIYPADWSPDGEHILAFRAVGETYQFVLISVVDGAIRIVKTFPYEYHRVPKFSPDGRYIVYDSPSDSRSDSGWPERDLLVITADGGSETRLVEHPADDFLIGWYPTGDWVLFASDRAGSLDIWAQRIADGGPQGAPRRVKEQIGTSLLGFAKNGSLYYFVGANGPVDDIYTARIDMQSGRVLVPPEKAIQRSEGSNMSPRYSPNGRLLAYTSKRGHPVFRTSFGNAVSIRSLETGGERVFLEEFRELGLQFIDRPRWAPDSRSVLVFGRGRTDAIYRIDLATRDIAAVLELPRLASGIDDYEWSRDGSCFFYVRLDADKKSAKVIRRNPDTGEEHELYSAPMNGSGMPSLSIAVSWDGSRLCFLNHSQNVLGLVPLNGGSSREIHQLEEGLYTPPEWTTDDRYILVARQGGNEQPGVLVRVPLEGGESQELPLQADFDCSDRISLNPDGQRIAYRTRTLFDGMRDLWVMENFLPEPPNAE